MSQAPRGKSTRAWPGCHSRLPCMPVHGGMISKELNSEWTLHKSLVNIYVRKELGLILTWWQRKKVGRLSYGNCCCNAPKPYMAWGGV